MYVQTSLLDMISAISSQESASGHTPCAKPGGQTGAPSGPAPALASLSARQAKGLDLLTSGTYGPRSSISSASDDLTLSLANRLQARTALLGSTLYKLTWKVRATPSGRQIPALRATARRKSDSASTLWGWTTPTLGNACGQNLARQGGASLNSDAVLAGWPTAAARDWKNGDASQATLDRNARPLNEIAMLSGWRSTRANDFKGGVDPEGASQRAEADYFLPDQVRAMMAHDKPARLTVTGEMLTGSTAGMESGGQLNPAHSRWLMGLPPAWDDCAVAAMRSLPPKRRRGSRK